MEPVTREDLVSSIQFALWRMLNRLPSARRIEDCRVPAESIVDHLTLCRIEARRRDAGELHGTPQPLARNSDDK